MATVHTEKIGQVDHVTPGATSQFIWKNPPWATVLGYFAYPTPPAPSGPHGAASGSVTIAKVSCFKLIDHYNGDKTRVTIEVHNDGTEVTGYDLYQSWID